jgi:hypothetical protein|tara:strand:+ start:2276 stop:2452 length:177 start_codon:yes stop_codon:yes gene_type:complete
MAFKTAATFEFTREDWESYRETIMQSIKAERMALMSNGKVLSWVDEELAKLPEEKEKV